LDELFFSELTHFPPCIQSNKLIPCEWEFDCELDEKKIASHPKITLIPPLPNISALLHQTNSTSPSHSSFVTLPPLITQQQQPDFIPNFESSSSLTVHSHSPPISISTIPKTQTKKIQPKKPTRQQVRHQISRFPLSNVKHKNWDERDMLQAMKLVITTKMSARAVAEMCNVPRSTLWDRMKKFKIASGEGKNVRSSVRNKYTRTKHE
jgi:hypothetical protein